MFDPAGARDTGVCARRMHESLVLVCAVGFHARGGAGGGPGRAGRGGPPGARRCPPRRARDGAQVPDDFDERSEAAWLGGATLGIMIYLALSTFVGILLSPWLLWRGFRQLCRAASEEGPPLAGWARLHYIVGWALLIVSVALVCFVGWTVRELWSVVIPLYRF